ncbi:bifunctional DNA-binding transcriptional regulator/O6-methylguanine-DNA methyltransferase Ada [Pseudomonas graminis]|uniref:methylated-DNA--[protein]-cysteine S-methyltransferase n=1 Tax=Pseudomonas graminis TaxID=158627 RepID=A0A1H9Y618_9PSED|nr:bifunctional DNA-binding transcriptional regulator/O6-methylguanine-DNA methyltransferase Ada [Pseudomonas graminis]SES64342.1 AraC family transcriptional regulator, regulatory protein of adaptative response / methylated-DNA-[protein]-cysteine methyltransferase [Pseudomonas graminis]
MSRQPSNQSSESVELDPRWNAVVSRDASADGLFVYGVRTTGVYCRPGSSARLPRPENVVFFHTAAEAEAAGFRPSKRAAAERTGLAEQHAAVVAGACRLIAEAEWLPTLAELAAHASMSPWHFHRVFKAVTGLTPKGYANAHRADKVRSKLTGSGRITDALYDAGFNSNSRFYEASAGLLGMRPTDYRKGGVALEIRFAVGECFLGAILVAQSARGVCAILLGDDPNRLVQDLQDQFHSATLIGGDADFEQLMAEVVGFIEAPKLGLNLPLDLQGTAFQQRVWQALAQIPPGTTASYAQIAQRIGAPTASRAVALACAANHIAVAIPCHRVVRSDGALSGYRWGVERKRALLDREGRAAEQASGPAANVAKTR